MGIQQIDEMAAASQLWALALGLALACIAIADLSADVDDLLRGYRPGDELGEASSSFARQLKAVTSQAMANAEKKELGVKAAHRKSSGSLSDLAKKAPDIRSLQPAIVAASGKESGVKEEKQEKLRQEKAVKEKEQKRVQKLAEQSEKAQEKSKKEKEKGVKLQEKAKKQKDEQEQKVIQAKEEKAKEKAAKEAAAAAAKKEAEDKMVAKEKAEKKAIAEEKAREKAVKHERPNKKKAADKNITEASEQIANIKTKMQKSAKYLATRKKLALKECMEKNPDNPDKCKEDEESQSGDEDSDDEDSGDENDGSSEEE